MLALFLVNSLLATEDKYQRKFAAAFEKQNRQYTSVCAVAGAFLCGMPIFVCVLVNTIW